MNGNNNKSDLCNSRALFVLKIITMSFAILACIVIATVFLTKWITELNRKIKESSSKIARAAARLNKFRKERIKHILRQRRLQLREERRQKKNDRNKRLAYMDSSDDDDYDIDDLTDDENAINDFDNELSDMLEDIDDEI